MTPPAPLLPDLAAAAQPYALRAERTSHSIMPDLVFSDSSSGRELLRLRWFDFDRAPQLRTIVPVEISPEEQRVVERHIEQHVAPVIRRRFSYAAWVALADPRKGKSRD